jgi:hypothetical protein
MAILDSVPGLHVEITVLDRPLIEHAERDDSNEDTPTCITRYVEAQSGASFAIRVGVDKTFPYGERDISYDVSVDGARISKPYWESASLKKMVQHDRVYTRIVDCIKGGSGPTRTMQRLMFSELPTGLCNFAASNCCDADTNPDDTSLRDVDESTTNAVKNLGLITLNFWRAAVTSTPRAPKKIQPSSKARPTVQRHSLSGLSSVPEKALKGKAMSQKVG